MKDARERAKDCYEYQVQWSLTPSQFPITPIDYVEEQIQQAMAEEQEAIAKMVEGYFQKLKNRKTHHGVQFEIADAIRARGK